MLRRRSLLRAIAATVGTALAVALPFVAPAPPSAVASPPAVAPTGPGYWLVGADGSVYSYGGAADFGSLRGTRLARPVAGMAPTPTGAGYWMVGSDGGIFSFGDAAFHGSTGDLRLNQPIVGMAATPTGKGYWFVAADGGIFSFGDAAFYGSTGAMHLNQPIVGMAPTPSGKGYWFVASDGGVFSFGDAGFFGSTGALHLNRPIVGMAPTPSGQGYWFVASDGGIFSFGDAGFYGSTGATPLNKPIVGMAASPTGQGYWFVASDGGIFNFGDAAFLGSAGGGALPAGVVVMAGARGPGGAGGTTSTTGPTTATSGPAGPAPTTTTTAGGPAAGGQPFQIGLIGDTSYTPAQDDGFQKVLAQLNANPLAFVIHDGDVKDPQTPCTDERLEQAKAEFNQSTAPVIYTPGDNEWMDCDNVGSTPNQQPMDAAGRLDEIRELFFHEDTTLGVNRFPLTSQRQAGYPENVRWSKNGVLFATVNAPGPTDNLPAKSESGPRRVANRAWLEAAFDEATSTNAAAVMIIWQVDPWQPIFGINNTAGYWGYLMDVLKERSKAFGKPVVLVHGDTHICRMDNPWGAEVPNFTRLETHGTNDSGNWIRATVDPSSPTVFSFNTVVAAGGLTRKAQEEPTCPAIAP
ncbi:MAG TPA: hypothetical protein VHL53_21785 [Acidimicrobiia bacterium]|nr:hypothetical protein [Acidimicrobiia bacterium]